MAMTPPDVPQSHPIPVGSSEAGALGQMRVTTHKSPPFLLSSTGAPLRGSSGSCARVVGHKQGQTRRSNQMLSERGR